MATRNIALGITVKVNGTAQTVKSVDELKNAISTLEGEIATAEFGSDRFKQLSGDLAKLKAGFRDINKEIEGADTEQALGAFASSVNGVTGAFLVATSAVQAFGIEGKNAEELAKIQARALAAVNIALGIRQIAEAAVKFQQIQRNIAEKASLIGTRLLTAAQAGYTAVVAGTTGALKALRIALASTGIGLAVVAIGALISKLTAAKDETEELAEETKTLAEFESEAAQNAGVETLKIQNLAKVVKNAQVPLEDRVAAYKDLQKLVPELAGYTLEEAENLGVLNQAIEDQIELIKLRARATALESYLVDLEKQRIATEQAAKQQQEFFDDLDKTFKLQEEYARASAGGFAGSFEEYVEYIEAQRNAFSGLNEEVEETTTLEGELLELQTELSEKQGEIDRRIQARTKSQKDLNKAETEEEKLLKERIKLLNDAAKALGRYTLDGEVSAKVLDDANKILEKQNELLAFRKNILEEQKSANEVLAEDFEKLIGGVIIPDDEFKGFRDQFLELFNSINKDGTSAVEQYQQLVDLVKEAGGAENVRKNIGADSLAILQDYFETNVRLLADLESYNTRAVTLNQILADTNLDINQLVREISDIQQEDAENLERKEVTQRKILQLVTASVFPQQEGTELTEEQMTALDEITKSLIQQAGLYNGIFSVQRQLADLSEKVKNNTEAQEKALGSQSFKNLRQFIIDNAESIDVIEETFKKISEGSSNLTEEQIENINKLIENIKLNNLTLELDNVAQAVVALFNQVSSQISQIVSAQNSLAMEQLQYQEEQTLATIGSATAEARAEQERQQKVFAQKRFDLEKRARVSELQLSLFDAVANGAAAYIQALTVPPPLGFLLANLTAGLAVAQIAVIKSQLGFARNKQFVARRGGLIGGGSHEMGGTMLNAEGGEFLVNRQAVSQFGDILSQINTSTGGRPLAMDDSRIVEEIRRQNQRPIKTYVLDQDIQDTRKINARLEDISRL